MLIREVILENFMSYEYARVPLKPGLNIVVGPNGSGKSAFLQAICVALGETYTERSKRLSDLIRWGEKRARVSLLLDNSIGEDGRRPIPQFDSDVIRLSRTLRRDGRYSFQINQRGAQKQEVVEILRRLGFDPDNMLIIMHQNMAEIFAALSPQERLKGLEEAVGFQSFRADVLEAKKRLSGILSEEESLNQLLERSRETLNYWREQYERLQEKRRHQTRLSFLQREMAWSRVSELEETRRRLEGEVEAASEALRRCGEDLERYSHQMMESSRQLKELRGRLSTLIEERVAHERDIGVYRYAMGEARDRIAEIDGMMKSFGEWRRGLEEDFKELRGRLRPGATLEDYFKLFEEVERREAEAYETWVFGLRDMREEAERQLSSMEERLTEAEGRAASVLEELRMVEAQIDEAGSQYIEARIQAALLKERMEGLGRRLEELRRDVDEVSGSLREAEAEALIRGARIETGRSSDEVLGEIRRVGGMLMAMADVREEAEAMYESYSKTYRELLEKAQRVRESRIKVMEEVEERVKRWREVTRALIEEVNTRFQSLLSRLQARGEVRLANEADIEEAGLELYVGFKGGEMRLLDPYTQSGGERTTAVMAFLLSLQQRILSPFRAVDEFDLHMDQRNREVVTDFLFSTLEGSSGQYLVITPSQLVLKGGSSHIIMVHKTEGSSTISLVERDEGEGGQV
jgi:chromosome segregation ATPase